jgi:hypothetical protein
MSDTKLAKVMRGIADGTLTRTAAAEALECSGRHVNRLMKTYGVVKPRGKTVQAKEEGKVRQAAREARQEKIRTLADRIRTGKLTAANAVKELLPDKVSIRTIYRFVADGNTRKRKRFSKKQRKT